MFFVSLSIVEKTKPQDTYYLVDLKKETLSFPMIYNMTLFGKLKANKKIINVIR